MWTSTICVVLLLTQSRAVGESDSAFLERVEKAVVLNSKGQPIQRIGRDTSGGVVWLNLREMTLSEDDVQAISRLQTLQHVVLFRTNITDSDLKAICALPRLEGLNLTSTEVTDAAVDELVRVGSLRYVCLGNVKVSPEAIKRLKQHSRANGRRLSIGYTRRTQ